LFRGRASRRGRWERRYQLSVAGFWQRWCMTWYFFTCKLVQYFSMLSSFLCWMTYREKTSMFSADDFIGISWFFELKIYSCVLWLCGQSDPVSLSVRFFGNFSCADCWTKTFHTNYFRLFSPHTFHCRSSFFLFSRDWVQSWKYGSIGKVSGMLALLLSIGRDPFLHEIRNTHYELDKASDPIWHQSETLTIDAKIGVFGCPSTIVKSQPQLLKT
jgi:hypothetical protein